MAAIALSFSLGIAAAQPCRGYSFGALAAAGILLGCAAFLALRRNRFAVSFFTALAAIALSGFMLALAHRDGFSDSDLRHLLARQVFPLNEPVSFEGCVVEDSAPRGRDSVTTIELNAFQIKDQWVACKGRGILSVAQSAEASTGQAADLVRGDKVRGWAVWQPPRNYQNPGSFDRAGLLSRRGIFVLGRSKSTRLLEKIPGGCSSPWTKFAAAAGAHVRRSFSPLAKTDNGQPYAVLASLVIGDYSGLNNSTRETFQNSGTYHVLVVSGLHVAWIAGILLQFLKLLRVPERARYLLAALVILLYTCIVGFQASITRCLWMFLLYLTARMIFRHADAVNILLAAALVLLVAQPGWLYESGFQLSFLSVMAIAMTAVPAMQKYLKPIWSPLSNAGEPERLFLHPGPWHRRGRWLRTHCEVLVEEIADSLPRFPSRMLLWISRGIGGAGLAITGMILTSVSVQLWLEPLLAHDFNRMSWISPLANLVIVPFSSIVLATGIAATLAAGLPLVGPAFLSLAGSLASLLIHCASHITAFYGAWQRCPTPASAWIVGAILLPFIWSFFEWGRFWIPCTYIALLLVCVSCNSTPPLEGLLGELRHGLGSPKDPSWEKDAAVLSFTFLDVGEGDSTVIRFPDKRTWLLDAGGLRVAPSYEENAYAFDIGEAVVSRYLWHEWIPGIDQLILSHSDQDHAGGVPAVMRNFRVSRLGCSQNRPDAVLDRILKIAGERRVPTNLLHEGKEEQVGAVSVVALHPRPNSGLASSNENSVVLQFSYGRFSALLPGDLERAGEREFLERTPDLRCRLLKVAHHGSRSATSLALLDKTRPQWAVISVGRNNPFGHPSPEVTARLRQRGTHQYLTLDEGAITLETDGTRYVIKSYVRGILEQGDIR